MSKKMDDQLADEFRAFWKKYLADWGMSPAELWKKSGIERTNVHNWINGKNAISLHYLSVLISKCLLQRTEAAQLFKLTLEAGGFPEESFVYMADACADKSFQLRRDDPLPDTIARDNQSILVLRPLTGTTTAFYTNILLTIRAIAEPKGFTVVNRPIADSHANLSLIQYYPDFYNNISGVVALACDVNPLWFDECQEAQIPIVLIHDNIEKKQLQRMGNIGKVTAIWEDLSALRKLVVHLIKDHKCTGLRVITGDPKVRAYRKRKVDVIKRAAERCGVKIDKDHIHYITEDTIEEGGRVTREHIIEDQKIDAVICSYDEVAYGVLQTAMNNGREDIRVTGYDDIPMAADKGISSITQHRAERAKLAFREILKAASRSVSEYPKYYSLKSELKLRDSCCAKGTTH